MIKFTKEELKYIEMNMDIIASIGISRLDSFSKIRSIGFSSKIEKETIERMEFETILVAHGITPKQKLDIEHQV